jgi:hypothetical protein
VKTIVNKKKGKKDHGTFHLPVLSIIVFAQKDSRKPKRTPEEIAQQMTQV